MSSVEQTSGRNLVNRDLDLQLPMAPSYFPLPMTEHRPSSYSQNRHPVSIPLRDRNVEKITIMQAIKDIFLDNAGAFQEQSAIARKRVAVINAFVIFLIAQAILIILGPTLGGIFGIVTRKNSLLGASIILLGIVVGTISLAGCMAGYNLMNKREKELQLSQMRENFEKIDPEEFTKFVATEISEFQDLQQKVQASVQTDPRKFLEILYQICQIFSTWKEIEQSKQVITDYGALNNTILPQVRELNKEVQQDLQHLVENHTGKKQSNIKSLNAQIAEEKKILEALLTSIQIESQI